MKRRIHFLSYFAAALFCFISLPHALASTTAIYFASPNAVGVGQEFTVSILIDTDQPVNAYAVTFSYSPNSLSLERFDDSKSIMDVSQGQPSISTAGSVSFKGGSLVPQKGSGLELLSMTFKAIKNGTTGISFNGPAFYLANGKGTKILPQARDLTLNITSQMQGGVDMRPENAIAPDDAPPDIKDLSLVDDPFGVPQKLLSFSVSDGGSGVKSVAYRTRAWFLWSDAQPAVNALALSQNIWAVEVEAWDNQGNASDRVIYDWRAFARGPLILIVVLLGTLIFIVNRGLKRRRSTMKA